MSAENNIAKLRKAGVPPFTYNTTLPQEGQQALRDIVKQMDYVRDTGYVSYLFEPTTLNGVTSATANRLPSPTPSRVAAVFAKELALAGRPVNFTTLAGFLREVRLNDYAADGARINPLLYEVGKGFFVITDFDDTESQPSTSVFRDGLDILIQHLSMGGGLVLACNRRWTGSPEEYTPTFLACVSAFTRMPT